MSTDLALVQLSLPAMSAEAIDRVRAVEANMLATQFQFDLEMHHLIHGGAYHRTCLLRPGVVITGALIKIPTTLVIDGDCFVWLGDDERHIQGRAVVAASAGRKQVFFALKETWITMSFPTQAKTVAEAEREFTDQFADLAPGAAGTEITGE